QGSSLWLEFCCLEPSSLNRPHPPHPRTHRDFTAWWLIRNAFAVRERRGDPRVVPGFSTIPSWHAALYDPGELDHWVRFWFYDVDLHAVPRRWLRWAFDYLQAFRKVTDGTPCDTQLATYLPEADIVLSSDGGFIDRIEECRKYAPCFLPAAERLPPQRPQNAYDLLKRMEQV